jgi:hypothetical protein
LSNNSSHCVQGVLFELFVKRFSVVQRNFHSDKKCFGLYLELPETKPEFSSDFLTLPKLT